METSLTGEDQLYQRATKLIDCHVNIAVTWSKHDFPTCEIYHSECHCGCVRPGVPVNPEDEVRVVPSLPSTTAVERAGKLGVVNQAQSLILCPVLYQFAVSVSRSIAQCRTVAVEVPNDHLLLVSYRSQWLMERETFTWWFVD